MTRRVTYRHPSDFLWPGLGLALAVIVALVALFHT